MLKGKSLSEYEGFAYRLVMAANNKQIDDAGYQTEADLQAAIEKIIGEAPEVLDTLPDGTVSPSRSLYLL